MKENEQKLTGPLLTDSVFFVECLDCTQPGLEGIPTAAAAGDFTACRKQFAAYARTALNTEAFFRGVSEKQTNINTLVEAAERACRNVLTSVGTSFDFGEGPIDWYSNPTFNKYPEWTWQLSRHPDIVNLAKAYHMTGEARYASKSVELMESWIHQAVLQ